MATLVLSAAGAALGAGFGGTVLGLSGAVIGRAMGATLGRVIDQQLMGGSDAVEAGRIDRLRLTGAGEGEAIARLWGRARVAGHVIWASAYQEHSQTSGGGKGRGPAVTQYSYSVSLAIGLCEGPLLKLGRIWADGVEIAPKSLNLRLYHGHEDQQPDPKIEAVEGAGMAPAYRGLAYVVIEDLDLSPWGNRVPMLSFELARAVGDEGLQTALQGVAIIPGTGEYALATSQTRFDLGLGQSQQLNSHSHSGLSDFETSLSDLRQELPRCGATSLVVSWFGDDLRVGQCRIRPKVEQHDNEATLMPWRAGGISRAQAHLIPRIAGRSVYGGTPSDQSVIEAILALKAAGKEVMFYPFILMEQMAGNLLPNPYGGTGQAVMPWRGRITTAKAAGQSSSSDRSAAARAEVAAFFGTASGADFTRTGPLVTYHGPDEWGLRRFILHYAHLCAAAGGVESFCIGSEMVGLTRIRAEGDSFPAVEALCALAQEVRQILGPECKISYAADWTEYGSYVADGNVYFPLDPLWAHEAVDFIGIDNYMPLADWRDDDDHADAPWHSPYNLDYLQANIEGGEGFDWYYDSPEGEAAQRRLAIEDGAYDEPWLYRVKDLRSWWHLPHHERREGLRQTSHTPWEPMSKPIRFTEYGCAAINKGANHPNRFLDLFSSESLLPRGSDGRRDDLMQMQYLRAVTSYWAGDRNPLSSVYGGRMLDLAHSYVWTWDARPFPQFPAYEAVWSDGQSYGRGHWLNGRATNQPLSAVIADICAEVGLKVDVTRCYGALRGYIQQGVESARATLQPLLLAYGVEVSERGGTLVFEMRGDAKPIAIDPQTLALSPKGESQLAHIRASAPEAVGTMRLSFIEAAASYEIATVEARPADEPAALVAGSEMPLILNNSEAKALAHRWLAETTIGRDTLRLALPPSRLDITAGRVIDLKGQLYRVDTLELGEQRLIEATRHQPSLYSYGEFTDTPITLRPTSGAGPSLPLFMDLPLLRGDEAPHQPHIAVSARPWAGPIGVWKESHFGGFELDRILRLSASLGQSLTPMKAAPAGQWDHGAPLRVKMNGKPLYSASKARVLNGANVMAIGDGSSGNWEVFQFTDAELVGADVWHIWGRLRGQAGTDGVMPDLWPAGSFVVLLNEAVEQIGALPDWRGLSRNWRVGLAGLGFDDVNVVEKTLSIQGVGLRPFSVCHLRKSGNQLQWTRRTRQSGDGWEQLEVPLAEEREAYLLRIMAGATLLHEETLSQPLYSYNPIAGANRIGVAQLSASFGPGPFRWLTL